MREGALPNGLCEPRHDDIFIEPTKSIEEDACDADTMEVSIPVFPVANSLGFCGFDHCALSGSSSSVDESQQVISLGKGLM